MTNRKNWVELQDHEEWRQEVRIFAVLYERGTKWSRTAAVARNAGVSLSDASKVLKKMRAEKVIEAERHGKRLGYRTFGGKPSDYRAALVHDARRMKLIPGAVYQVTVPSCSECSRHPRCKRIKNRAMAQAAGWTGRTSLNNGLLGRQRTIK